MIWICLPHLPTKFYNVIILQRIGQHIGKLIKVDTCTSVTIWGRYARIFIQIPMGTLVKTLITIGAHTQQLIFEGEGFLFKLCGHLGHTM